MKEKLILLAVLGVTLAVLGHNVSAEIPGAAKTVSRVITLTTTAQKLTPSADGTVAQTFSSIVCYSEDDGATTFYAGGSNLSTSNGGEYCSTCPLKEVLSQDTQEVWGLVASSTLDVRCQFGVK